MTGLEATATNEQVLFLLFSNLSEKLAITWYVIKKESLPKEH